MDAPRSVVFRIATKPSEFEQIHRLNYKTFVQEIPQHTPNPDGRLVDPFHDENTYFICLDGPRLVGMIALRGNRPFSLDRKLADLDSYLPPGRSVCEIRLLAVEPAYRNGIVFRGLVDLLARHGRQLGYDLAVISGTVHQQKLYRHLGFVPFGPLVGSGEARFQPMQLTLEAFMQRAVAFRDSSLDRRPPDRAANFLPGPVSIARPVRQALNALPVSHRSEEFARDFQETRAELSALLGCRRVEILMGSGTVANDAVAAQLSLQASRGIILANGEFGYRLADHANRFGLRCDLVEAGWGEIFDPRQIESLLAKGGAGWLWAVHCETSTGILNDIALLREVCRRRRVHLCLDCVSSMGTVPVDLRDIYLASGVSGKGLGAYPGLALVCYNHAIAPSPRALPRYLDLGLYAACDGIPFTISSNLVSALQAAVQRVRSAPPFEALRQTALSLRTRLRELGFSIIGPDTHASPGVVTIALPPHLQSEEIGRALQDAGFLLSYRSSYLLARNWIQIGLMGEFPNDRLAPLLACLMELCPLSSASQPPSRAPRPSLPAPANPRP